MSSKYTISEIDTTNSHVTITLDGGAKTLMHVEKSWTTADLDEAVWRWASSSGGPSFVSDGAERTYAEKDKPTDDPAVLARDYRDFTLGDTDMWMLPDKQALMTDSEKTNLTAYRKELRELPAAGTSKWNPSFDSDGKITGVTWPTDLVKTLETKYKDK